MHFQAETSCLSFSCLGLCFCLLFFEQRTITMEMKAEKEPPDTKEQSE
jgi:hypothetical protein